MAYTAIDDPTAYFQTTIYTGDGSTSHTITNGGNSDLQPDWLWIKSRSSTEQHFAFDSVRGQSKYIFPNATNAEGTAGTGILNSFNSDGFTLGNNDGVNANSETFVAWNWKAGTSFTNDASSTGIGSIDSAGSFNNDAGFSIVSWTGTLANGTVKHGLSTAPKTIFIKCRGTGGRSWVVYHDSIGNTKHLTLNETDAEATSSASFNNTSPTSSVFSLGSSNNANDNTTMIAYCFAEKKGYSKFGSYTGNGNADGPYIHLGFKPAFVMAKKSSGTEDWSITDNKMNTFNVCNNKLRPNSSSQESTGNAHIDFTAQGFKWRSTSGEFNASGSTYIYMCFAEQPFVSSSGVPATAR
jgi:hypothetical protein